MNTKEKGVTLIALVVTIIMLIIIAVVSFKVIGESGILDKATVASTKTVEQAMFEKVKLMYSECEIGYYDDSEKQDFDKEEYIKTNFEQKLQGEDGLEDVAYKNGVVSFKFNGEFYKYSVGADVKLSGNVEIGEYVEYPFEYSDVYTEQDYSAQNGWRVLDDGNISGSVKIISTGIPMKWSYDGNNAETAIQELKSDFLNTSFKTAVSRINILGSELDSEYAKSISSITLSELNAAYSAIKKTSRTANDISSIDSSVDLFYNSSPEAYYWVLTKQAEKRIYYVLEGEFGSFGKMKLGIRPVIELKDGLKGVKENEFWKIVK